MRAIVHETISGEPVTELQIIEASWDTGVCREDEVSVTVPGYTGRSLYHLMVPRKYMITLVENDGTVRGSGVLGLPEGDTDQDGVHRATFSGRGIESLFDRRHVLPFPYWPLVNVQGFPLTARDTYIQNVEYGTMMKKLYQQAMSHPGGSLPVDFEPDRPGTRQRGWNAVDGNPVQDAIRDLSELMAGVEWDWVPSLDSDDKLSFSLVTGSDAIQEIYSPYWHTWQSGGNDPDIRDLDIKVSPEYMCSTAIFTGGKDEDRVLMARSHDVTLLAENVPLSEIWDTSHSSVSEQNTLDQWADKATLEGQAPVQYWEFEVRADRAVGLRHGDWCTIQAEDHWIIPNGTYSRRVVEMFGEAESTYIRITVAGELSW